MHTDGDVTLLITGSAAPEDFRALAAAIGDGTTVTG